MNKKENNNQITKKSNEKINVEKKEDNNQITKKSNEKINVEKKESNSTNLKLTKKIKEIGEFNKYIILWSFISLIISFICALILFFQLSSKVKIESDYQDKKSFYQEKGFDLMVSGASKAQVNSFKSESFIEKISSASIFKLNIKTKNDEDSRDVILFDNEKSLELTEFTEKRIIHSQKNINNFVYIDYKFSKLYNVSLGDKIFINISGDEKEFVVTRVYRSNYNYQEGVVIGFYDIFGLEKTKSQLVYFKTNKFSDLKNFLKSYKPLGLKLDKLPDQTDAEYQQYSDEFDSKNYYDSHVIDLSVESQNFDLNYNENIRSYNLYYIISLVSVCLISLLTSLLVYFLNIKLINKYIRDGVKKHIKKGFLFFNLLFMTFLFLSCFLTILIISTSTPSYYGLENGLKTYYLSLILPVIFVAVGYFTVYLIVRKK